MGALQRFERRLEGLVEGAFAKAFRGEVHPAEIADKLAREADDHRAIVGHDRVLVPNAFVVELSGHDHDRLSAYAEALGEELSAMVREHADRRGYSFVGPVRVQFEHHAELDTGTFRLRSDVIRGASYDPANRPVPAAPMAPAAPPRAERGQAPTAVQPMAPPTQPAPGPARLTYRLAVVGSGRGVDNTGARYALTEPVTVIGRSPDCDLQIADPSISRHHAEIRQEPQGVRIGDLGSTNGTSVNGQRIRERWIEPGDRLEIGTTRLVFERDDS